MTIQVKLVFNKPGLNVTKLRGVRFKDRPATINIWFGILHLLVASILFYKPQGDTQGILRRPINGSDLWSEANNRVEIKIIL